MPLKTEEEPQIEFGPEEELCIKAWNALDHLHGRNGSSLEVIGLISQDVSTRNIAEYIMI